MPQPKGHEPFSRFWTVNYKVIYKLGNSLPSGYLFSRPRSVVFKSQADADAFYAGLKSQESVTEGHPAPGTIQTPFEENFFNKKDFVLTFVNEHIAFVQVATL
jgi:hypothetical protein